MNIVPNPATEEAKRKVQHKLAQQKSFEGNQDVFGDDFFSKRKQAFKQKMTEMGMEAQ